MNKTSSNPLLKHFESNGGRLIHKWMHYFEIYHRHFGKFRKGDITVLEFGVAHGGSLQMWKKYFGKKARIIGVDIDPRCKNLQEKQISIYIGDQENRAFLKKLMKTIGPVDVVIEDGGHTMGQQITTFEEVYPFVKDTGVYLVEDLHTSYWPEYGGAYNKKGTFIEYSKALIDKLNAWHSRDAKLGVDEFTKTTKAMHIYDSIIVFEKGKIERPHDEKTGEPSFSNG